MNQLSSQHASRPATQQSAPYHLTTASSTPRHAYPNTSSGNFPSPLPLTYDGPINTQQSHTQQSNRSSSTINAVNFAGRGAPNSSPMLYCLTLLSSQPLLIWRHFLNDFNANSTLDEQPPANRDLHLVASENCRRRRCQRNRARLHRRSTHNCSDTGAAPSYRR